MKILIITKQSKYEYERQKFGLSHEQIIKKYKNEDANLNAILHSHESQVISRRIIKELFPDADFISMQELKNKIQGYDLVISFGGDNSFSYASHFIGKTPMAGVNSDPIRSTGALCSWSAKDLNNFSEKIKKGDYKIEKWTRIIAEIDGKELTPATSEYFFGEKNRKDMTRHVLVYRDKRYEQKNSGIIISTGAGSTGWYDSANKYIYPNGNRFSKTEKKAVFVITEPYRYSAKIDDVLAGEIWPGEQLEIHSLNDGQGYSTSDSWEEYDFQRGRKAIVRISEQPLNVIVPRNISNHKNN